MSPSVIPLQNCLEWFTINDLLKMVMRRPTEHFLLLCRTSGADDVFSKLFLSQHFHKTPYELAFDFFFCALWTCVLEYVFIY